MFLVSCMLPLYLSYHGHGCTTQSPRLRSITCDATAGQRVKYVMLCSVMLCQLYNSNSLIIIICQIMSFYVELCCFVVAPNVCQGTLMGLMDLWTIRKPKHKCHPVLIVSTTSCWAFGMVCFDETISTNWSRKGPRLFEPLGCC